jgi:hypothetical protein
MTVALDGLKEATVPLLLVVYVREVAVGVLRTLKVPSNPLPTPETVIESVICIPW